MSRGHCRGPQLGAPSEQNVKYLLELSVLQIKIFFVFYSYAAHIGCQTFKSFNVNV